MHSEFYTMTREAAETLNAVKSAGGNIVSVGTTSTRTLETIMHDHGLLKKPQALLIFLFTPVSSQGG